MKGTPDLEARSLHDVLILLLTGRQTSGQEQLLFLCLFIWKMWVLRGLLCLLAMLRGSNEVLCNY